MNLQIIVGCPVKISRSDGRVHYATVKSIDLVKNIAMVEWQDHDSLRGKEVELVELFDLNKGMELVNSTDATLEDVMPPTPAQSLDKKYGGRLRSSRIPAPPSSSAAAASKVEETVVRKSRYFAVPEPEPARPVLEPIRESSHAVVRKSRYFAVPEPEPARPVLEPIRESSHAAVSNQPGRRKDARLGFVLPSNGVPAIENEEPVTLPSQPGTSIAGRRRTMAYPDGTKGNKRLSCPVKQPDLLTKRGKMGDANRPNLKFYQMIEDFRETLEILPLSTSDLVKHQRICVAIRKRPLNKKELARKDIDVVSVPGKDTVLVHEPKQKVDLTKYLENQTFHFDYSFQETATNELVYWFTAKPLVQSIFEGGMATCFAYGQTGSGKTHTMGGDFSGKSQNSAKGIYALAAQDVFTFLNQRRYASLSPYVTFFEIYNGKVFDLLNNKAKLRVLEDDRQQVQVVGLEEVEVSVPEDVIKLIELGTGYRTSGQTSANANSSRSHAILQIVLRRNDRGYMLHGKFSLIDLAGNERGNDVSSNDRATMLETAEINRSLLALKECIRSLGKNSDHIPFRESTLTKVLRDSFIGDNSRTCMIAMVSPGMPSCDYTLNTLRYADRVKELNGTSKAGGAVKAQEPMDVSSDEDSVVPSMFEAMSQIQELEDKVQEELKRGSELLKPMGNGSYDIEEDLPHLVDYAKKLLETVLELESAVAEGKMARVPHFATC